MVFTYQQRSCPAGNFTQWLLHFTSATLEEMLKTKERGEHLPMTTNSFFHPHQYISVDERMEASKARIGIKQFMKNK